MKDEVLKALIELTTMYSSMRNPAVLVDSREHFVAPIPHPPVPILIKDLELVDKLQAPLEQINNACIELVAEGKIRLGNKETNQIFPAQDGHLYEVLPLSVEKIPEESKLVKRIRQLIAGKQKLVDWQVYNALGGQHTIQEVNAVLTRFCSEGSLRLDAEWFNPGEAGYTYTKR